MKPIRYNSFLLIHKALRTAMYHTAQSLQEADLSNEEAGQPVMDKLGLLLALFESHAHAEDTFFNEPLEAKDAKVATLFEKEHEEDHRLTLALQQLVHDWKNASTAQTRWQAGQHIFYAFNEFIAFNLYHMTKEEIDLNNALWKHYSDDEIRSIEQQLVSQIPPDKMMHYALWLIRGLNDVELNTWLTGVKQHAPSPAFQTIMKIAEQELSPIRFEQLHNQLFSKHAQVL